MQKDSGSAVKDTIDSVNKSVGDAAVKGIEKSREFRSAAASYIRGICSLTAANPSFLLCF